MAETYTTAIKTINPRKATTNFHNIFVDFAKFYEVGGVTSSAAPDLESARRVLETGTKIPFRTVDELAEVWCEWSEMELRNEWVSLMDSRRANVLTLTVCVEITTKRSASCKEQQLYLRTLKSTIMTRCVLAGALRRSSEPLIAFVEQTLPVQARLFKSLKLWSFYVDLEESIGSVDTTKTVYDKILELRIANAQVC